MSSPLEPRLALKKDVAAAIRRGHPWVFRLALAAPKRPIAPGELVAVTGAGGEVLARGFWDPDGPIAVRVLARGDGGGDGGAAGLGGDFVAARVASAAGLRRAAAADLPGDTLRLVHGEADGLPGLVVDVYGDTGVVRFDGAAAEAAWARHGAGIVRGAARHGFTLARLWARPAEGRAAGGRALVGDAPPPLLHVREAELRFEVDVVHGQKTGLFLDQRPNRALVGRLAAGRRVLNVYCYTGGFSVAAGRGGARSVTSVDLAAPAIAAARKNAAANGLGDDRHEAVTADAREFLAGAVRAGRRWDLVITDPPSFAPSEKTKPGGLAAYRALAGAAAAVVAPGGLYAAASCSSHVTEADLRAAVAEGLAGAGRGGRVVFAGGAGPDHPVSPAFPEGRYLKFLLLALD